MLLNDSTRITLILRTATLAAVLSAGWLAELRAECEEFLPCTITFDDACPNVGEICGATFIGGGGCITVMEKFCYSTGLFSYIVDDANPLTIELSDGLTELNVFFVNFDSASGEMHFFNECGEEVGNPLFTNGNCLLNMPPPQSRVFEDGVRSIEVTATGGIVFIDTFTVALEQVSGPFDFDGDCAVGPFDLAQLLGSWGPCPDPCEPGDPCDTCPADADGDCNVGAFDLALLLGSWGPQ